MCFWGQNMVSLNLKNMTLTHIKKDFCEKKRPQFLEIKKIKKRKKKKEKSRQISTTGFSRAAKI
jgi:hypothetical protein